MSQSVCIEKRRLRDEYPGADGKGNPWLWFAFSGDEQIVCGVNTRKECEQMIEEWRNEITRTA